MSRRMMSPQMLIKSQIVDDKFEVDLYEVLEKYGTVVENDYKTITLQIYNQSAGDEAQNTILTDSDLGSVVVNGSITITRWRDSIYIQGMLFANGYYGDFIPFIEIESGSYENGIKLASPERFDLYVIRV